MAGVATTRDSRIDIRVKPAKKALFVQAAAAQGQNLSEFAESAMTVAAEMALADQTRFSLCEDSMGRFLATLEEDPRELPALRELFARKSVFEA